EKDENVILSLNLDSVDLDKKKSEDFATKIAEEIEKDFADKKIRIILTGSKKLSDSGQNSLKSIKKIIAVASAKGGVGKSTFAVNLAASLQKIGYKVAIVDADIYGPSIPHLLSLKGKPEVKDGLFIPLVAHNIKVMSIGFIIDENSAGMWRGPMITKILHQLIRSVNWDFDGNEVDFMIVDMPPGTGDIYLSLAQSFALDGVIIVSTPQSLAVADVVRSIDCFKKLQVPILGLVQNMAYLEQNGVKQYIFGQDNAKKMAQKNAVDFLGDIALYQEISDASEEKIPFVIKNNVAELSLIYGMIAEKIIDKIKN
ncbi:MAG TPA: Mrp/NBP35 family ATP-binding protein, partial [Rickettsiales bacterium]|nr:Mrp/NBP35 family ATP-binding protein [Rickettsiales bacterium]